MRAIAVVLVYHAGVTEFSGGLVGVDLFFVISGFLITGLLLREIERSGHVSLPTFYARRAKRLLPATGVVLVATAVLTWLTTSVVEWRTFGADIFSAAVYLVNWRLAGRSVDYLAEDVDTSPVQHFWSLAISRWFISAATPWPGYAALAPTPGTAGMIIAGYPAGRAGPGGLLGSRPAV